MFKPSVVAQPAAADVTPVMMEMVMGSRRFSIWPDAEVSLWSTGAAAAARTKVAAVKKRILKVKWDGFGEEVLLWREFSKDSECLTSKGAKEKLCLVLKAEEDDGADDDVQG